MNKDEMMRKVVRWFGLESPQAIKFCRMAETTDSKRLKQEYNKLMEK